MKRVVVVGAGLADSRRGGSDRMFRGDPTSKIVLISDQISAVHAASSSNRIKLYGPRHIVQASRNSGERQLSIPPRHGYVP